jgi:4,5-dihydroxyphthalate decarboxylase
MKLRLSIATDTNPRTRPIMDGSVTVDGIDLVHTALHPSEMFWRQLKFAEFDVSEMSFSSLIKAIAGGNDQWVGIPVFTTHHFFQNWIVIRKGAGIERPEDMAGKRVGVPEFQQTAAVWSRGILKHQFGVDQTDMEYWMERLPETSHGGSTGFVPPPGVTVNQIPLETNIGEMMLAEELDATLLYLPNDNLIDRSKADLDNHPGFGPLFPDPAAEGLRYYRSTNIFPINHTMVIKRSVAEENPWAVLNILKAFNRANELANQQRLEHIEYYRVSGLISREAYDAMCEPLVQHGVRANRETLEAATQYSFEQGLTPRLVGLEEVFARSTMDQ